MKMLAVVFILSLLAGFGLAAAVEDEAHLVTPLQKAQMKVLALEAENDQLRRALVGLQQQVLELSGPLAQQQRDKGWKALEQELGCPLDRQTGVCLPTKTTPAPAKGDAK